MRLVIKTGCVLNQIFAGALTNSPNLEGIKKNNRKIKAAAESGFYFSHIDLAIVYSWTILKDTLLILPVNGYSFLPFYAGSTAVSVSRPISKDSSPWRISQVCMFLSR